MSGTLARTPIEQAADIVAARQHARRLAELLGYDRQAQTRIATAVSEIARNACTHGHGGEVEFSVDAATMPEHFWVRVSDRGPGFADLEATLSGRSEGGPARGSGLVHARRLVDRFEVESTARGAVVRLGQRIPRAAAARLTSSALEAIAAQISGIDSRIVESSTTASVWSQSIRRRPGRDASRPRPTGGRARRGRPRRG